jgi:hypothetical protein
MRVLQLCPLWYPISHAAPGGIESLLAHLGPHLGRRWLRAHVHGERRLRGTG